MNPQKERRYIASPKSVSGIDAIKEISNFASSRDCSEVISAYERCRMSCSHRSGNAFFDGRVLWINSFPDTERKTQHILQVWRRRAVDLISEHIGSRLYSDTIQVVRWDGQAMPPHQDDRHPDGSPHNTPWRAWASIIYLNDDFDGGEIYFPDTGEFYKPVVGSLVFFEGSQWHGVRAVTRGVRYTSPSWYAKDPAIEDPYAHLDY